MAKYDWTQLEKEYILSDYKTVADFLKSKNISRNGSTQKNTKGWNEKKVNKELKKSEKVIEKVIEKESENEAQQIVDIKNIANDLAIKIMQANKELNMHLARNKAKTKIIEYDYKCNKPSKEIIEEKEEIKSFIDIIDRQGLKMLTSALKDLNEIIGEDKETDKETLDKLDEVLKGLGGVV